MTVAERRQALLEWFYADEERSGWTTSRIETWAIAWRGDLGYALYSVRGRHKAYRDLKALERDGQITRGQTSGKATWWYA